MAHRKPEAAGKVTPGISILTSYVVSMAERSCTRVSSSSKSEESAKWMMMERVPERRRHHRERI
jgi:hypothetical protein